ncbi:MAG: hypothetical protein B6I32_04080 [Desulfobacterium sp. 4572_20]|nr:MAG: hypothetical protein B6I32_04080 [Desulfobacterium sp. 4572_20]
MPEGCPQTITSNNIFYYLSDIETKIMQPEIAIIADDLTGAADTGILFSSKYKPAALISHTHIQTAYATLKENDVEVLSINTDSRCLSTDAAITRLNATTSLLLSNDPPAHIYKKVDSSLRGNLGTEIEVVMEEMGFELSFIAPAFPEMGRTTLNDIHFVHNVPIADTELAEDPVNPLSTSCLTDIVTSQCNWKVNHINLNILSSDEEILKKEINQLKATGIRHLVFDVTNRNHLNKIVRLAFSCSPVKILLAGSAGLAKSFSEYIYHQPSVLHEAQLIHSGIEIPQGKFLLVIGTASTVAGDQIASLCRAHQYEVVRLAPEILLNPDNLEELMQVQNSAQQIFSNDNLIIKIDEQDNPVLDKSENRWTAIEKHKSDKIAQKIVDQLGCFIDSLLRQNRPSVLYLSGGDTARAILEAIGARGLLLKKEIFPGLVLSTVMGGTFKGMIVVTKAGAFGDQDILVLLHNYLSELRKEHVGDE